ncbi:MAG: DMT family transporter, partial [Deltaproteobacteria bacterium]|nr:DMT family transporter [Deltaproteobacteria bacterium]
LGAHLVTWIAAVQLTTVANAAVFFSINPVITAVASWLLFGERIGRRLLAAIGFGLLGVAVIGWGELGLSAARLSGDLWAMLCSLLFTVYVLLGRSLRQSIPTLAYVTVLYGTASLLCFVAAAVLGLPLAGYDARTWLAFALLALVPTVLGHSGINYALRYIGPGRIAAATLLEPPLAGLIAFFAWGEALTPLVAVGYLLAAASVLLLSLDLSLSRGRHTSR